MLIMDYWSVGFVFVGILLLLGFVGFLLGRKKPSKDATGGDNNSEDTMFASNASDAVDTDSGGDSNN